MVERPEIAERPYYLNDFHAVIDGVVRLYPGLLNAAERDFIARLQRLSQAAQLLYARLANRKGPYFRVAKLDYPEIGGLAAPLAELTAHGFLAPCAKLADGVLGCFTLPELRVALRGCGAPKGRRGELLAWLNAWPGLAGWAALLLAEQVCVGFAENDPWPFLRFLFFGELRDNLADFVTRALGHIVTESVAATALAPCFASRAEADDAFRMARLYARFRELRAEQTGAELLFWWQNCAVERAQLAAGREWFDRLVERLGRMLEREKQFAAAMLLYATCPMAPARERRARLLLKAGEVAQATSLLREMASSPHHAEEAYAARQLLARLEKKTRRHEARQLQNDGAVLALPYTKRAGFRMGETTVEAATVETATVEAAVLAHYRAQGWQGVHSENWLWNASFGLLLWDIIYDPASGAFHSPLQFAPSDLYGPEFYPRRRQAIEARLTMLAEPARAFEIMQKHFAAKQGIANPFLAWHEDLPSVLHVLLHRVPGSGHAAVLRHMAQNLRQHGRGFLDLFIWNDADYRFIEIKGEGDQLAPHQFEWLRFFAEAGIKVSLENVLPARAMG